MNPPTGNEPVTSPAAIKPRDIKRARQLAWLSTGLGHIYAGAIVRGLWLHAGFAIPGALAALMLMGVWCPPVYALFPMLASLGIYGWSVWDAAKIARGTRPDYRLKDYNNGSVYFLLGTVPSVAVATAIALAIMGYVGQSFKVAIDVPAAGIHRGDWVAMSKLAYRDKAPEPGDAVIYRSLAGRGKQFIGHIRAVAGQTVTTASGERVVPAEHVWMDRDGRSDGEAVSSYAISGKITFRYWPLAGIGKVSAASASNF